MIMRFVFSQGVTPWKTVIGFDLFCFDLWSILAIFFKQSGKKFVKVQLLENQVHMQKQIHAVVLRQVIF